MFGSFWIQDGSNYGSRRIARGPIMEIDNVRREDAGTYMCTASNNVGTMSADEIDLRILCKSEQIHTMPHKNIYKPYSIRMYWPNFWKSFVHLQQNVFEKIDIEVGSSHLYASFGTFFVQIRQLFKVQWEFI